MRVLREIVVEEAILLLDSAFRRSYLVSTR